MELTVPALMLAQMLAFRSGVSQLIRVAARIAQPVAPRQVLAESMPSSALI